MLEQIAYQLSRVNKTNQRVYQVGDLESLSASTLYSEEGKKGSYIKSNDKNLNFYNWINLENFGETDFFIQENGEKHKEYRKRLKKGEAIGGTIFPNGSFSSGSGY